MSMLVTLAVLIRVLFMLLDSSGLQSLEILDPLLHRKSLKATSGSENGPSVIVRCQRTFNGGLELMQKVLRASTLNRVPPSKGTEGGISESLKIGRDDKAYPGICPSPPTLAPTPRAPFRPNSTATRPKGSSRDGISANSAPENM